MRHGSKPLVASTFDLARPLLALVMVYAGGRRWTDSETVLKRAIGIAEATVGPDHFLVGDILARYAAVLRKLRRASEAKELETRAQAIGRRHSRENLLGETVDFRSLER